jgi:hypothetical protein
VKHKHCGDSDCRYCGPKEPNPIVIALVILGVFFVASMVLHGCHREVKKELQVEQEQQDNSAKTTDETQAETKKQDPTDVDTKTIRSDNAVVIQEADGSSSVAVVPRDRPLQLKKGAKVVATVPVSQTVVAQNKHIGAVETEKSAAKKSTETDDSKKDTKLGETTESSWDFLNSWKFYLSCVIGLVVLLGGAFVYLKFIKKVSWL